MRPDHYTKVVLTVIAAALIALCVENLTLPRAVSAQPRPTVQRVMLVAADGSPLNIVSGNLGIDFSAYSSSSAVPVSVRSVPAFGQNIVFPVRIVPSK